MTEQGDMIKAFQNLDDALDYATDEYLDRDDIESAVSDFFAGTWQQEDMAKGYRVLLDGLTATVTAGIDPVDVKGAVEMYFDAHADR